MRLEGVARQVEPGADVEWGFRLHDGANEVCVTGLDASGVPMATARSEGRATDDGQVLVLGGFDEVVEADHIQTCEVVLCRREEIRQRLTLTVGPAGVRRVLAVELGAVGVIDALSVRSHGGVMSVGLVIRSIAVGLVTVRTSARRAGQRQRVSDRFALLPQETRVSLLPDLTVENGREALEIDVVATQLVERAPGGVVPVVR